MINDYPSHLLDPREKGRDWIIQYVKAAWNSFESDMPREIFYHAKYRYEVNKQYAMGNQSINKYRPLMGIDEDSNESWLNIDWSVIPIVPKFRRIALGKMSKMDYNIVATPVDSIATSDTEQYFATAKAKILLREQAKAIDPELLNTPALQLQPGEAGDLEELEMQMAYTHKHQMAIEAEQAIKLIFEQNEISKARNLIRECLFDYGVGGYKEYLDSNGVVKFRVVDPRSIVVNRCKKNDFSDAQHIGEVIEMTIADLKQMAGDQFSAEEYEDIAKNVIGKYGNSKEWPSSLSVYNKGFDRFRIRVLDIEFYSVNEMVYEKRIDRRGNLVYARAKYEDRNKRKDKYERYAYKVIYKAKWIVDSKYMFDYGLCTDMKRAKSSMMDTKLSYHLYAPEFWDMKAYGIMEQIIPIADAIQVAWYRLQNVINQSRPKGIMIEMGALEDIPLGSGGMKLTPMKVLDLYNKTGTLVYRKMDSQGRVSNVKPIEELENGLGRDAMNYWQLIQNHIQMLRDITGMNEMTDGSTPDPRTLTTVAKLAYEGTNNSLAGIISGEKNLLESLAYSVMLRLQDSVQMTNVEGYVRSLGNNSLKFIRVSPNVAMHDYGIFLEDKPTDDQRAMLLQQVQAGQMNNLLDIEDAIIIQNTDNLKVAQQLLAFKIKKRRQEEEEKAMRMQQMNAQVQQQSAMVAEQAKQQTIQLEGQVKSQIIEVEKTLEARLLDMKYQYEIQLEQLRQTGKLAVKEEENFGTKNVAKIKTGQPEDQKPAPPPPMPIFDDEPAPPTQEEQPEVVESLPEEETPDEGMMM